jgi:hypothetical protein
MTREQLEHAIRAACDVSKDRELWIFGSQAILGQFPAPPVSQTASVEVDVQPRNLPEAVDKIDGTLGELSIFHSTHGFYVHGLLIEPSNFPNGWEKRAIPVRNQRTTGNKTGWCLEAHDLAVSKLLAFREKDRQFVRTLLLENMVHAGTLLVRISELQNFTEEKVRLSKWVKETAAELGQGRQ